MFRELGIKNFVLIENLQLALDEGLNVLTGETGAGKSIMLDAVGLLMGDRFRTDTIRQGADKSEIDGVIDAPKSKDFHRWWDEHGFEKADELLIRREGTPDGRSRAFLNDRPVTTGTLQELAAFLVDIHGQNEHQQILKPAVQLEALDRFAGLDEEAAAVAPLFREWRQLSEALTAGRLSEQERAQRVDLYQFQVAEIDKAKLKAGEEEELAARLPELKNAEKLRAGAAAVYDALAGDESAVQKLSVAEKNLTGLAMLAPVLKPKIQELREIRARLDELIHDFQIASERWEADPEALENLLNRQDLISRLQKKYGATVSDILAHGEKLRTNLDQLENSDLYRQELGKKAHQARQALEKTALVLSAKRQASAKQLSQFVKKQLADLELGQATFRCVVEALPAAEDASFSTTGLDRVSFEWSPNPGEGIRPLKDIASGGEMSRVMLALKTVLAQADAIPALIFDEVDAGIGGLTAQSVGKKLRALSRHHQILCVSHLPQIASSAHAHFQVSKKVTRGRTAAEVVRLEPPERLNELARLLGSTVTPTSVQHAKELLAQNQ